MYAHHTRIYPKRDDVYRAEFPGPYYSTSSVYSYSPTSASDCPEHGRSRKKITVILTTSIILATLGVLSIAGVAAYLGILSKSISNNASQSAVEESYQLSDSNGRINSGSGYFTTTEENEYIFTTNDDLGGLDALEGVPGDSLVDLTNSLLETSRSSTQSSIIKKLTSTLPPPRTIEGHFGSGGSSVNRNSIINHGNNDIILQSSVVTGRPLHPREEENAVRFFTEEASTSSKPFTKVPPRHNRNRQRFPLTNSHSLGPSTSTTTMLSTTNDDDDSSREKDHDKQDSQVIHLSHPENAKNPDQKPESLLKESDSLSSLKEEEGNEMNGLKISDREGLASNKSAGSQSISSVNSSGPSLNDELPSSVSVSSTATSSVQNRVRNEADLQENDDAGKLKHSTQTSKAISGLSDKNLGEDYKSGNNNRDKNNNKVRMEYPSLTSSNAHENDEMMQADMPIIMEDGDYDNQHVDQTRTKENSKHKEYININRKNNNGESDDGHDSEDDSRPETVTQINQEDFKPIIPIISSERDDSLGLLKNHKMPLSFDRINPEYYDTQPWTPLLNRPNLDKRPRVEIDNPPFSSTEPIIVWNSEEPEESVEFPPPQSEQTLANYTVPPSMDVIYGHGANITVSTYYGYGHSGPSSEVEESTTPNMNKPGMILDEPITYPEEKPVEHPVQENKDLPKVQNDEVMNGFRPSKIPAYTILIPHIPNSSQKNTTNSNAPEKTQEDLLSPHLSPPEDYANNYKMDRMGEVGEDEAPNDDPNEGVKYHENMKTPQASKDKNNNNKKPGDKIVYNFEAVKTIPVPEDDELRDDDYMDADVDEFTESVGGEPKIYRLDPDSVDLVPDTLSNPNKRPSPPTSTSTSTSTASTSTDNLPEPDGTEQSKLDDDDADGYDDDSVEQKQNEIQSLRNATMANNNAASGKGNVTKTKDFDKEFSPASMELVIGPQEPDTLIKSTTDLIMSTLGSLNLIKTPGQEPTEEEVNEKLRNSDVANSTEVLNSTSESPLFPPVRSYVGVNLPLRPKPNRTDPANSHKQFRYNDGKVDVTLPNFPPDFATSVSLQKVLSMMLGGNQGTLNEKSRQLINHPLIKGLLTRQNVTLVVANETGAPSVINLANDIPVKSLTQHTSDGNSDQSTMPTIGVVTSNREQKSFSSGYRDSKIDHAQFTTAGDVQHVPVPLIMTEPTIQSDQPSPPPHLTAFPWVSKPVKPSTKAQMNSPVYKFILKKGQSVEDLLKEIFLNYTENLNSNKESEINQQIPVKLGMISGASASTGPGFKSLEDANPDKTTVVSTATSSTPVRISHHVETTPLVHHSPMPTAPTSSHEQQNSHEVQTSTSIVINEDMEEMMDYGCGTNDTFKCVSTGKCIPSYLRCNFIKECDDNSDEEGCLCADFLKANGNSRKICDGIPDCADASDEYMDCEYCQPGQYICAGSRTCINKEQICDSKRDCQYGDDESDCVKIGDTRVATMKDDFAPVYHKEGRLMVRKTGTWGKLCVESFSSVVSHWEVKDLARAVCKALTFTDYEKVEKVKDSSPNSTEPYYELHYGSNNQSTSSGEAHQRPGLGFRQTECKSKLVVNVTCQDLQCGVAPRAYTQRARIVGGANSLPGKWPWQAALYKNGEYQCGATLISSRWLLSAGHCFYHAADDYWVARLGTLRRGATVLSPYEQVVRITHIFLHPEYKDVGFINDVSLLRLEKEVNFTDFVRPVCLPGKESRIRDGRMCTVVGWGQLFEVGRVFPDTLQEVQIPLISTGECRKRTLFLPLYKLTDQMFCAGFDRGGRDACLGDSGGPLQCLESDGRWSLYGVTSNGYGCARANRPGVYTKVTSYLDWIYEKMSQDSAFTHRDKSKPCPGHRCLLGECLDKRQICNGIRDCIEDDGSDERGANCTTYTHHR